MVWFNQRFKLLQPQMEFMKSLLSIISGSVFIGISFLVLQLVALLVMVAYKKFSVDYPFLNDIGGIFRYLIAIPAFLLVMFIGGYLSAMIVQKKVWLHAFIVGAITTTGTMWLALGYMKITTTGVVMIILMLVVTVAGGLFWQRRNRVV